MVPSLISLRNELDATEFTYKLRRKSLEQLYNGCGSLLYLIDNEIYERLIREGYIKQYISIYNELSNNTKK